MKVLCIYSISRIETESLEQPFRCWSNISLGISYVMASLRAAGHTVGLRVLIRNKLKKSIEFLHEAVRNHTPEMICLTAVASEYLFIEEITRYIKKEWPQIYCVVGGVHATLNPEEVIMGPFDALCIGEGESPITELCDQLSKGNTPGKIKNIWIKKKDGSIEKNETRPFIQDLDSLSFPVRKDWYPYVELKNNRLVLPILLGRGCPYLCTYCSNHVLKKVASGKYVRMRSPENIIKEIQMIHEMFPECKFIFLEVEAIALNKKWTYAFTKALMEYNASINNYFSYGCNFRIAPNTIDDELFDALAKANITELNIGLESGNERIRREILKRNYKNEDFIKAVTLARKHHMKIQTFNMVGLPGETLKEHMDTVMLNRQVQPDNHFTGIFFPYPGTELYDRCIDEGLIKQMPHTTLERLQATMDLPGFSKSQIKKSLIWFNYRVYKGYKPTWKLFIQTIIGRARSNPLTNLIFQKISNIRNFFRKS